MKLLSILGISLMALSMHAKTIYDFEKGGEPTWRVVDDGVMGGLSKGNMMMDENGHGIFWGDVSLANNGGFSSIRYDVPGKIDIDGNRHIAIRVKGDGKDYQLRVKGESSDRHSYIKTFSTDEGEWKTVKIPLAEMYPSFRGRKLDIPDFNHSKIEEVAILIANKKNEEFRLLIDKLWLE